MAYPRAIITYEIRGERVHVLVHVDEGPARWCGVTQRSGMPFEGSDAYDQTLTLSDFDQCDHGGTRREPSRWHDPIPASMNRVGS